jgi:hypothetical protein
MRVVFGFQEVWDLVKNGVDLITESSTSTQKTTYKEAKKKDYKALFLIHQCVSPGNFERPSKETRDNLDKAYARGTKVKKVRLHTYKYQYELLQMEEKDSVGDIFTRVTNWCTS